MRQTAAGNAIWGLKNLGFRAGSRSALRLSRLPRSCLAVVALLVAVALAARGCSWAPAIEKMLLSLEQQRAIGELRRLIGPDQTPCHARALHLHIGRCVSPNKAKVRREAFHHRGFSAGYRTPFRIASDIDEHHWLEALLGRQTEAGRETTSIPRLDTRSTSICLHHLPTKRSGCQRSSQPPQALLILDRGRGAGIRATPWPLTASFGHCQLLLLVAGCLARLWLPRLSLNLFRPRHWCKPRHRLWR